MHNVKNVKNNSKVTATLTATTLLFLGAILLVASVSTAPLGALATRFGGEGFIDPTTNNAQPKAPMAVSQDGNNVYIVWWTNKSENWEVMFRASNDGGQTFGDKINLSNSSDTESQNAEIVAAGNNVFVSWWETSPETGSSESVLRVSTDGGQTFSPMIMLGMNGTINTATGTGGNDTTTGTTVTSTDASSSAAG
ncbi:MAG: hypothetical protein M3115_07375 [Thermoproteota archaeon]|nr:hypothetical protein [Thermoproteota archaeon]